MEDVEGRVFQISRLLLPVISNLKILATFKNNNLFFTWRSLQFSWLGLGTFGWHFLSWAWIETGYALVAFLFILELRSETEATQGLPFTPTSIPFSKASCIAKPSIDVVWGIIYLKWEGLSNKYFLNNSSKYHTLLQALLLLACMWI